MYIVKTILECVVFIGIVAFGFSLGTVQGILCSLVCYLVSMILEGRDE
jgi:hypothetical protein